MNKLAVVMAVLLALSVPAWSQSESYLDAVYQVYDNASDTDPLETLKNSIRDQFDIEIADDPELLTLLQQAGCVGLFIGLETFNESSLTLTEKGFNVPGRYKQAIDAIHSRGIFVEAGIIFGFDNDDVHIFSSTLDLLEKIGIDAIQVSILTPLPGTPLYEELKPRLIDSNWEHYDYRHVVFQPLRMSPAKLQAGTDWVIQKYYSPWRILKRTVRWLTAPGGLRNFIYPFVLNWAYFGRVKVFNIKGIQPDTQPQSIPAALQVQPIW